MYISVNILDDEPGFVIFLALSWTSEFSKTSISGDRSERVQVGITKQVTPVTTLEHSGVSWNVHWMNE